MFQHAISNSFLLPRPVNKYRAYFHLAVVVVVAAAVVLAVAVMWESAVPVGRPYGRSGKSAGAGTTSAGSSCGRCDYTAASYSQ